MRSMSVERGSNEVLIERMSVERCSNEVLIENECGEGF